MTHTWSKSWLHEHDIWPSLHCWDKHTGIGYLDTGCIGLSYSRHTSDMVYLAQLLLCHLYDKELRWKHTQKLGMELSPRFQLTSCISVGHAVLTFLFQVSEYDIPEYAIVSEKQKLIWHIKREFTKKYHITAESPTCSLLICLSSLLISFLPILKCVTPSPSLDTVPLHSCPKSIGPSTGNWPPRLPSVQKWTSEPHIPTDFMRSCTSVSNLQLLSE